MARARVTPAAAAEPGAVTAASADEVAARAELVARASYGRLLALLAAPTRDIAGAEDALAGAFERALRGWPSAGIPDNPEAWLLTVARNRQRDEFGSAANRTSIPLDSVFDSASDPTPNLDAIPDKRLELLFVCAHPAIDPAVRTPLMLQTVLGFEAQQVAQAFAVPSSAMAQRLVRAKRRIRDAGVPFAVPDRPAMATRLPPVLEAIYGAYAIDWQRVSGETLRDSLSAEALYLATTLAELLPAEPEVHGLAALLCLSIARTDARTGPAGEWIPLEQQNPALWDATLIARGEAHLRRAHALSAAPVVPAAAAPPTAEPDTRADAGTGTGTAGIPFGRFQLEAAMQSVHCARATMGHTDWRTLRALNEALVRVAPTLGAHVSLASTIAETEGPEAGLAYLDALAASATSTSPVAVAALARFQPAWATRAHLLAQAGRLEDARAAYDRAITLTTDTRLRAYLAGSADALG